VLGDVSVVVCLRRFVVVVALGRFFVEENAIVDTFREQEREGLVGSIVVLVAFGSGFVGRIANTVEELVGVFIYGEFNVAFVTLGRDAAGGLVRDRLFVVRGFCFCVCFWLRHYWVGCSRRWFG
jgi:hypothetical protein